MDAASDTQKKPESTLLLLTGADVYTPHLVGNIPLLVANDRVLKIGNFDPVRYLSLGPDVIEIQLKDRVIIPGIVDPHQHLIGGSGECCGFRSLTPAITIRELARAGITTVVGTLGTDTTTRGMASLLAKVKALRDQKLSAYLYTGGYRVPPTTLFSSAREDILLIQEVIGTGELAISDDRSSQPTIEELARIVSETYVGGMLTSKAGVTHFHLGPGKAGLTPLIRLLDSEFDIHPESLYPTHINRTSSTIQQAAELSRRGCFVDMDTVDEDLSDWLPKFIKVDGKLGQLSLSSDAGSASPSNLFSEFRRWCRREPEGLGRYLPLITSNAARALKLSTGHIRAGALADLVVLEKGSLEIVDVMAQGQWILKDGVPVVEEGFAPVSNRDFDITSEPKNQSDLRGSI